MRPEEPGPKNVRQVQSNVNVLLTIFLDCNIMVRQEFLPQGRTAKMEYHLEVVPRLLKEIRQKRMNFAPKNCMNSWPKTKP